MAFINSFGRIHLGRCPRWGDLSDRLLIKNSDVLLAGHYIAFDGRKEVGWVCFPLKVSYCIKMVASSASLGLLSNRLLDWFPAVGFERWVFINELRLVDWNERPSCQWWCNRYSFEWGQRSLVSSHREELTLVFTCEPHFSILKGGRWKKSSCMLSTNASQMVSTWHWVPNDVVMRAVCSACSVSASILYVAINNVLPVACCLFLLLSLLWGVCVY